MLDQLLAGSKSAIVAKLASQFGLSADQADAFIGKLIPMIEGLVKGGGLDVQKLVGGDASALTSKLDMTALAGFFGGSVDKAKQGVTVVANDIAGAAGSNKGLVDQIVGLAGGAGGKTAEGVASAVSGLAGKLFGKG
jgi:hypothetical protein